MERWIELLMKLLPTLLPVLLDCFDKPDDQGREQLQDFAEHLTKIGVKASDPISYSVGYGLGCICRSDDFEGRLAKLRSAAEAAGKALQQNGPSINV